MQRHLSAPRLALQLAWMLAASAPSTAAWAQATFQGLGTGGRPNAVSADGEVVLMGRSVWKDGTLTQLDDATVSSVSGWALSGDGSVVVGGAKFGSSSHSQPFVWENGTFTPLSPEGSTLDEAVGVSNDGRAIAGNVGGVPVRWDDGVLTTLAGGGAANGISADGSVVVGRDAEALATGFAVTWQGGVRTPLESLPGAVFSEAVAASDDGGAVVGRINLGNSFATRWDEEGIEILGTGQTSAEDVSADGGRVVGSRVTFFQGADALMWDANGEQLVQDVLEDTFGLDLSGWKLTHAYGISADGRTIVGYGTGPNGKEAWLATIPEPSTGALIASGLLALRRKRPRKR